MERLVAGATRLGVSLSPRQIQQFQVYYEELVAWNRRINLTTITSYEGVQLRHFLDSLTVALAGQPLPGPLLDVGSGAGFPGLPLKVVYPHLAVTLLESVGKKAAFLHHLVRALELEGVEVITARAEVAGHDPALRERFPCVVSRALAPLPTLLELALPFCATGGMLVCQKKASVNTEMRQGQRALQTLGGRWRQVVSVPLEGMEDRLLVVVDKVAATPAGYPRRPGQPARRPLT